MTQRLREAIEAVSQLPDPDQDAYASWILAEIASENRWDKAFADSGDVLARLAHEALEERRTGKTIPLDPDQL